MRARALPFIAIFAVFSTGLTSPLVANTETEQTSRHVAISELRMQDGSVDTSLCTQRYGNGYTVSPSVAAPRRIFMSDMGHTITLVDRSEILGHGIFAQHNRFTMTFPSEDSEEAQVHLVRNADWRQHLQRRFLRRHLHWQNHSKPMDNTVKPISKPMQSVNQQPPMPQGFAQTHEG